VTTSKIPLGWDVYNAILAPRGGRLAAVGDGYWNTDTRAGYSGYDGIYTFQIGPNTYFRADSDRTIGALIKWLTNKSSGANLLVQTDQGSEGWPYGVQFTDGLTRLGHTVTITGLLSSLNGYDPLDFDAYITPPSISTQVYRGEIRNAIEIYDYILSNKGAILTGCNGNLDRYGINAGAFHDIVNQTPHLEHYGPGSDVTTFGPAASPTGGWKLQRPFTSSTLGALSSGGSWNTTYYALTSYSSYSVYAGTNTMGGSFEIIDCALYDATYHPHSGIIGLWRSS